MRHLIGLALLTACLSPAWSKPLERADLERWRDAKLKEAWLTKKAQWSTDYDHARKQAKEEGKLIFAYFTCSYRGHGGIAAPTPETLHEALWDETVKSTPTARACASARGVRIRPVLAARGPRTVRPCL